MKNNKIVSYLLNPPVCFLIVFYFITIISCGGVIVLVVLNLSEMFYSYIVYVLAALTLAYSIYTIVKFTPRIKNSVEEALLSYKFTDRLIKDFGYRTRFFTLGSLLINVLFAAFEVTMSFISKSIWYGALGSYHLLLCFTRVGVLKSINRNKNDNLKELKLYKNTGICIIIFNFALAGAIVQMMFSRKAFNYIGLMIFVMAAYTFWKITVAIVNIIKAKKYNNYGTQSLRNLNLSDAIVSMYALQTALIATFSEPTTVNDMKVMNIISGCAAVIITILLGIYMIYKSKRELEKSKEVIENE